MKTLERIRQAAKAKGWDLARVATEAQIERSQIYQISASKKGTSKHLPAIASVLGVEIGQLTGESPAAIPAPIPPDIGVAILREIQSLHAKVDRLTTHPVPGAASPQEFSRIEDQIHGRH